MTTMERITFGRTPLGQLVYDMCCTKLTDAYLARKHSIPIAELRALRTKTVASYKGAKRKRKGKR